MSAVGGDNSTLALLESLLLLDSDNGEGESSVEEQAIEGFAEEIELREIDGASSEAAVKTGSSSTTGQQRELKGNSRCQSTAERRQRKCTYAVRREETERLRREAWSLHQQYTHLLELKAHRDLQESALAAAQHANRELRDGLALVEARIAALLATADVCSSQQEP